MCAVNIKRSLSSFILYLPEPLTTCTKVSVFEVHDSRFTQNTGVTGKVFL